MVIVSVRLDLPGAPRMPKQRIRAASMEEANEIIDRLRMEWPLAEVNLTGDADATHD